MNEEEFKKLCTELGGVFIKTKEGAIKCVFPTSGDRSGK